MKYLIVGFGSIGRRHFRNLLSLGERDIYFCRTGRSTLEDDELDGYLVEHDLDAALAHDPDGVIIANPTAYHLDAAIPAAQKGCHILVEKPLSHSMERVEDFRQAVKESGSRVLVGFQFRFHPNLLQIRDLLERDTVGAPLAVRSHWGEYLPGWHPWEDYRKSYSARKDLGGGALLTLCHNFDYLRWLFGDGQVKASLLGQSGELGIDVEDTAEVLLEFQGGLIANVHLNFIQRPASHTLEVIGTRGTIRWDYYQNRVDLVSYDDSGQSDEKSYHCQEGFDRNELFMQEMSHFIDVVEDGVRPICNLQDGIKVLEIALAAGTRGVR